jgi:hypothetical protein
MNMPSLNKIFGIPEPVCAAIVGDIAGGLVASGSTQGTALPIYANFNVITTTAAATGVVLPAIAAVASAGVSVGDSYRVANLGANALAVYPPLGYTINSLAANTALSIPAGKVAEFNLITATGYIGILSA